MTAVILSKEIGVMAEELSLLQVASHKLNQQQRREASLQAHEIDVWRRRAGDEPIEVFQCQLTELDAKLRYWRQRIQEMESEAKVSSAF